MREFAHLQSRHVKVWTFVRTHAAVLKLILPCDAIDKVVGCNGDFDSVQPEIAKLMATSNLGKTVFAFAAAKVASIHYATTINGLLEQLDENPVIKQVHVDQFKWQAMAEVKKLKAGIHCHSVFCHVYHLTFD